MRANYLLTQWPILGEQEMRALPVRMAPCSRFHRCFRRAGSNLPPSPSPAPLLGWVLPFLMAEAIIALARSPLISIEPWYSRAPRCRNPAEASYLSTAN